MLKSAALWYLYFPHLEFLRLIGPRAALILARVIAWVQWVFLMLRGGGKLGRTLRRGLAMISSDASVAATLRRYLAIKHQYFVEWNVYPTPRGRRFVARTYCSFEGHERLDGALARGHGAILLSHHFGMFRMVLPALQEAGYETSTLVLRAADYAGKVNDRVAHAVLHRKIAIETAGSLGVIFHQRGSAFGQMAAALRQNRALAIAADGMAGSQFVDVPYLGGRMALTTGPAWLSLRTRAPILPTFCWPVGLTGHRLIIYPALYCAGRSRAAVEDLVRAYAKYVDDYTRRYPWAWWSWRRVEFGPDPDGLTRVFVRELPEEKQAIYSPQQEPDVEPVGTGA
jgi:lauroyl/myristoyl acyltransferase